MTVKRFNSYCDNENIRIRIDDDVKNKEVFHIYFADLDDAIYCKSKLNPILDLLNQLSDENEQLKQELKTKCIVNKQYEEYQRLIKMLDNVANYMQKQHKDMPIDDFVEWWNNIATEGL